MKDKIIQFLEDNILGKLLLTSTLYKLENDTLEGVYNDNMTFSNLVRTSTGFKFDMTTVTQELVYKLDSSGTRTSIVKNYTGTSVFRYELAMRKAQINSLVICAVFQQQFKIPQWKQLFVEYSMSLLTEKN